MKKLPIYLITAAMLIPMLYAQTGTAEKKSKISMAASTNDFDQGTYINANKLLMVAFNNGIFAQNSGRLFLEHIGGWGGGLFYPYHTNEDITSGALDDNVLFSAGLWLGGIDRSSGELRVAIARFGGEYVPGPMKNGTFQPDNPAFKVYKLYSDSLETNPNSDYINWPVDQGAPVTNSGKPLMIGDQMLWTVFNDANPAQHTSDDGSTLPLGLEIHQTIWAVDEPGDDTLPSLKAFQVTQQGSSIYHVAVGIVDTTQLTDHDYIVIIDSTDGGLPYWELVDITTGVVKLTLQQNFTGLESSYTVVDGFRARVTGGGAIRSIEVIANGSGVLDPPASGAMASQGFPTPTGADPTDRQQVGPARWFFHTGDNGGTNGGGTRGPYDQFISRTFRGDPSRLGRLGSYDWEMRFTGDTNATGAYDSSLGGGGYAWAFASFSSVAVWVPFELWRTGVNTPNDPSDDVRLIPWIFDDGGDSLYWMSYYGSDANGNCGFAGCEHSASGGDDDPYTDWIYWAIPADASGNLLDSPGDAGYQTFATAMQTDPINWAGNELRVMDRTVLVNWDGDTTANAQGGATVPSGYIQDLPEPGTVFRIRGVTVEKDTFAFTANPPPVLTSGPDGVSIYMKYKIYNKSGNNLDSVYISIYSDPDLGDAGDDFVGCDTLSDIFYCYNADDSDSHYPIPPAVGFKVLYGPIVPAVGQTAYFDGWEVPDHTNLGLTSARLDFSISWANSSTRAYNIMKGLLPSGDVRPNGTKYDYPGDPVSGTGDLDSSFGDKSMQGSFGPFDMAPGDSQFVLLKLAVGQGVDRLSSLTKLREILNIPFQFPTAVGEGNLTLPRRFALHQNYPNPFNPTTTIKYNLARFGQVQIDIFNILGQKVLTLVDRKEPAGTHSVIWDGKDTKGKPVATGIYLYRIKAGDFVQTKKMLLLK